MTPASSLPECGVTDGASAPSPTPELAAAVALARGAACEEAGPGDVGEHLGVQGEPDAATHFFATTMSGYRGWRWAVTLADAGGTGPITVSEVVLLPGPEAVTGPQWVPWSQRVRAGDMGAGEVMPTTWDDDRLAPGYLESRDPDVEAVAHEVGLGRVRVLSDFGRRDAAARWHTGEFGPRSDMARAAPGPCGTCGFYLPLSGAMRAAFGVCGNEISPADGHVVHAGYGCGAHSESEADTSTGVPVTEIVYDDSGVDVVAGSDTPSTDESGER